MKTKKESYHVHQFMGGYYGVCRFENGAGCIFGGDSANEDDYNKEYIEDWFNQWNGDLERTYKVAVNTPSNSHEQGEFNNLEDAIKCFDSLKKESLDFPDFDIEDLEIEIKKFDQNDEIEDFDLEEVPSTHQEFVKTGWFVK